MRTFYFLLIMFCSIVSYGQSTQELIDIGHRNYELGEYQEAIDYLNKAADKDQKNPEIFYLLGVCKSQLQKNAEAIKDYDLALALDPTYAEVYFEKGYSLFALNMLDEAIEAFDKSIKLKPNNAVAYVNRGSVKCIKGDKEGAMKDWKKAEELGAPLPEQECEI
jgi:tetratricopeptide (TPR) repeat protein|uniref:tetratricopeptide repeat protein n=1 Tax=Fulvivirga sp. TaxID=1931237 RepID=UPI00404A6141